MKKILIVIFIVCITIASNAQIQLTPIVDSEIGGLTPNNISIAEGRLRSIISSNGMESSFGGRFVLACKISALQREFSGTKMVQHLEVTFAIGDNIGNKCFGATSIECIGLGESEGQAMLSAIKNINGNNPEVKAFVAKSKIQIIDYYNTNGPNIIKNAQSLVAGQNWEEALYELTAIPLECKYYPQALEMINNVYADHINHDAAQILAEATAVWSADPNPGYAAEQAMQILSQIETSAKCYPQAQALMRKIETRVKNVTDADRAHERSLEKQRLNASVALQKARISACRDVAVAFVKRKVVVQKHYHYWW